MRFARYLTLFVCMVVVNGCGGDGENTAVDVQQPSIVQSSLAGNSSVSVSDSIDIVFSEGLDNSTINDQTIYFEGDEGVIDADISVNGATISVKPSKLLEFFSDYSLNITSGIKDLAGNNLDKDYSWHFSTGDGQWTAPHSLGYGDTSVRLGMDEQGHAIAVWRAGGPIYASYFSSGKGWSDPESISDTFNGSEPAIAMNARGDAIVVWESSSGFPTQIYSNVYIQGRGWQGVETAATDPDYALFPKVVIDNHGNGFAAWGNSNGVVSLSQYLFDQGWGETLKVSTGTNFGKFVSLASNANGEAAIAWKESIYGSATSSFDTLIMTQFYSGLTGWSSPDQVAGSDDDSIGLDVAVDAYGNSIIAYALDYEIYARRWSADSGWELSSHISDNVNWSRNNRSPKVEFDHEGNAMLMWADWGGPSDHKIYSKKYTLNSGWGVLEVVSENNIGKPIFSIDDNGNAIAVIQVYPDIVVNRYLNGRGWAGPVSVFNVPESASPMDFAMARNGTAILAYDVIWNPMQVIHFE